MTVLSSEVGPHVALLRALLFHTTRAATEPGKALDSTPSDRFWELDCCPKAGSDFEYKQSDFSWPAVASQRLRLALVGSWEQAQVEGEHENC